MTAASFGMGALPNCLMPLVNLVEEDSMVLDMGNIDAPSSSDPGVGAFTPYHNRIFSASTDIEPGMELFVSYGANYFRTRKRIYGPMPEEDDYALADELLSKFEEILNLHSLQRSSADSDLWDLMDGFKGLWPDSGVMLALPQDLEAVTPVLNDGGTAFQHYNRSIRDLDWLETHGVCMDNIESGNSTIPHAGRGAFATRFLTKGSVVTPAPLIHVPNATVLEMYDLDILKYSTGWTSTNSKDTTKKNHPQQSGPLHSQLLRNYCFGHPDSTLLLCPYGLLNGNINHSSKAPNVKLQWSLGTGRTRHEEWLTMTIDEWGHEHHAGLAFDIVALRDISQGEEILMDYGAEWEEAWNHHVTSFGDSENKNADFVFATAIDEDPDLVVRTMFERSYHNDYKQLQCRTHFAYLRGIYRSHLEPSEPGLHECRVLERKEGKGGEPFSYTVELMEYWSEGDFCYQDVLAIIWDLPRGAFYFSDLPYSRPHHQATSFRHEMGIPDDIFPEQWKNNLLLADGRSSRRTSNREPSEAPKV